MLLDKIDRYIVTTLEVKSGKTLGAEVHKDTTFLQILVKNKMKK